MTIPRKAVEVLAASVLACVLVFGIRVASASAGPIQNFKDCQAAGGSIKACCAGAGGTYDRRDDGVETCVIVEKKLSIGTEPPQTTSPVSLIVHRFESGLVRMFEVGPAGPGCDPNTVGCP